MNPLAQTANKAWIGAVLAALASFVATVQGRTDLEMMKPVDWIIVAASAVVVGLGVYTLPNKDAEQEGVAEPEEAFDTDLDLSEE